MRLTHGVRTLAAVLAATAATAAPAQAKFDNVTYPPLGSLHPAAHQSGSSDDGLIAIGALTAAVALSGGLAISRRRLPRTADIRVISGS